MNQTIKSKENEPNHASRSGERLFASTLDVFLGMAAVFAILVNLASQNRGAVQEKPNSAVLAVEVDIKADALGSEENVPQCPFQNVAVAPAGGVESELHYVPRRSREGAWILIARETRHGHASSLIFNLEIKPGHRPVRLRLIGELDAAAEELQPGASAAAVGDKIVRLSKKTTKLAVIAKKR